MKIFLIMALAFPAVADVAAFDVASVKPHVAAGSGSSISRPGGRLTIEGASLKEILFYAHGIAWGREYALSGPDWLNSERFDVVATFPPEPSRERVREMLRALLGERFGLRTHDENRKLESYVLLPARHGPKLTPNTTGAEGAFITGEDGLTARALSMETFADRLSGPVFRLERPVVDMTGIVVDMTGIKGAYDFKLNWTVNADQSLFTALQEQLGLRLVARKTTFSIVVVDHVDKVPTAN